MDYERRRGELPFGMESRGEALNYFAWQADFFRRVAHGRIIDHGAGTGGLVGALHTAGHRDLVAVEPDPQMIEALHERFGQSEGIEIFPGTIDDYLAKHGPASVDCILSSNVIEHIEDDRACLDAFAEVLRPGGGLGIYVPARPELFGSLDRAVGHVRRYTLEELDQKLRGAGFDVEALAYRNVIAILPWLVSGTLLKRERIGHRSMRIFDRVVFPVFRRVEDAFPPPYGLNLVSIATKPS